jgi:hypothetical protein
MLFGGFHAGSLSLEVILVVPSGVLQSISPMLTGKVSTVELFGGK